MATPLWLDSTHVSMRSTLGVIFGDVGTSPLYIFSVMFSKAPVNGNKDVLGALSLVLYTLILIPLIKYVLIVPWENDDGEVIRESIIENQRVKIQAAQNYFCFNNGNYTSNSTYSNNLNTILPSIPSKMSYQGFHNASLGQIPDRVNVIAFCRGDIQPDQCRSCMTCIQGATDELVNFCPNQRQAILWSELCSLRYSNDLIYGIMADLPAVMFHSVDNVTSPQQFYEDLRTLFDNLRNQAAAGGSLMREAAGSQTAPDSQTIYGFLQCSSDISSDDCSLCLTTAAQRIPGCCVDSMNVRILQPSCTLRYETTRPFYNVTRIPEAQATVGIGPSPPPSGSSPPSPPLSGSSPPAAVARKKRLTPILLTGFGSVLIVITSIIIVIILIKRWKKKKTTYNHKHVEIFLKNHGNLALKRYKYSQIRKMTKSFEDNLGKGGYGSVYKGKLHDGRLVAVKILDESRKNGEDFMNEVASISRTSHINIVTLLGFCFEGSKRDLIYEFMPNGSLDKFLSEEGHLGWETLFEIAVEIARGLEYLHRGCNMRILHLDIKPHNILLDMDFHPKIADFGLAKLCPDRASIVSMSRARGTVGYIAPEVFCRNFGEVSHKSDVYSYGMMVLEIVGERRNVDPRPVDSMSEAYFPQWVYKHLELNVHEEDHDSVVEEDEKRKLIIVGLWCIQTDPNDRPSMRRVVEMLEGKLESLQIPAKPYLSSPIRSTMDISTYESSISLLV
ncbi:hypothetical protein BUALT_Bualt05G0124500 [Buddleja alternifolia]|uniref:Receptor-like kinase n=1 Tax=Buddleja alternifolia TaxID=168488 RepID=A0AAV6XQD5_9LAMI|nr:hypothetical protein BUALT_Bualt05G0124500 [Buddleja alternifolia]